MSMITLDRPTITAAAPVTEAENDALLLLSAAAEKPARVRGGRASKEARAWSFGGNVD